TTCSHATLGDRSAPPNRRRATRARATVCLMAAGSDFDALVHLVDRTVSTLGRLQAIVDETLDNLEILQGQLRTREQRDAVLGGDSIRLPQRRAATIPGPHPTGPRS